MKKKLLVIGSFNYDYFYYVDKLPLPGETVDAYETSISYGGKGFNQAVAASRVSNAVTAFCMCGSDFLKKNQRFIVDTYRVSMMFYKNEEYESGEAHIVVDKEGNNQIIVKGGVNRCFNETIRYNFTEHLKNFDSILFQNETSDELIDFLFSKFGKEKTIFYNAAPARKIKEQYYQCIDYLFVNKLEMEQLSGCSDAEDGARKLLSKGVKNVVVTLGKDGALFMSKTENIKKLAINVKAVDTTGAGDTFVGFFVGAVMQGVGHIKAMDLAIKAAGISTTKKGSAHSIPDLSDVLSFSK